MQLTSKIRLLPAPVLFLALLGGSMYLSVAGLGSQSIWLDESYTWWFSKMSWPQLLGAARLDGVNPPLYYMIVKVALHDAARSEAALRSVSVVAHGIAIAAVWWAGKQIGGYVGAVAAVMFWALHPMSLWYAREARPYALAVAFTSIALGAFLEARRGGHWLVWALGFMSLSLALVTHYFAFVLLMVLVLVALADFRRAPHFFRRWTLLSFAALLPLAIWLVWCFSVGKPSLGIGWIRTPRVEDLPATAWNLISGYGGVISAVSTFFGLGVAVALGFAFLKEPNTIRHRKLAFWGLLVPLITVWVLSLHRPVYVDRYFLLVLPLVAVIVAGGAMKLWTKASELRMRWKIVTGGLMLAWIIAGLHAAGEVHSGPKFAKEDWRGLSTHLAQERDTHDRLWISEPEVNLPLAYYEVIDLEVGLASADPTCEGRCWRILRQPYTATHAFSQSVSEPDRGWPPERPPNCRVLSQWDSPTGISAASLHCGPYGEEVP